MKILAIDTSTEACSVALLIHNRIKEDFLIAPQQHSKIILGMIEKILLSENLKLADLTAIAFGQGPGSFTGLRIAASVAKGLGYAIDLPVVPISTLQAMAQGAYREFKATEVLAAIDARMTEIYFGQYKLNDQHIMQAIAAEVVCKPDAISVDLKLAWVGVGSGWITYGDLLTAKLNANNKPVNYQAYFPHAFDIALLAKNSYQAGNWVSAAAAAPIYLRNNIATPKQV